MPRFYIDTDDGKFEVVDEDGAEYRDLATAEDEATRALPEMAKSLHPARDWRQISATVRDETGSVRFRAELALTVERMRAVRSPSATVAA